MNIVVKAKAYYIYRKQITEIKIESPYCFLAICKSEPFPMMEFNDHVKRLHADSDYLFSLEYEV